MFIRLIDAILHWGVVALAFLLPLFFLPLTADFYDFNKQALLIGFTSVLVLAWIVKMVLQHTVRLTLTPLTLPLAFLTLAFVASALLQSPNQVEAFLGRPGLFLALLILMITITSNVTDTKIIRHALNAMIAAATILAIIAIYQFLGINSLITKIDWLQAKTFTPTGSLLALLTYLLPMLALGLYQALIVAKDSIEKIIFFLLSALMIVAIITTTSLILPGKPDSPLLLPYSTGWAIAVDSLKSVRLGLLGVGPDNFIVAFSLHRPANFNLTPLWNIRFSSSSNELLHLLTTTGLIGLSAWIFLIFTFLKSVLRRHVELATHQHLVTSLALTILISFLLQFFLPANLLLLFTSYFLLILWAALLKVAHHPQVHQGINHTQILPFLIGIPVTLSLVALWFFGLTHIYAAETAFKLSLDAIRANRGTDTYNFQIQAITLNPYLPRYHRAYATTNLALANALAQSTKELSTPDRQKVTQLIQQAIREGKLATQLNPQDPANWETLAQIYRNLINVASGADNWTVAAYAQSLQSDPFSPSLRLELGGVYYAIGRYDDAIRAFQQATELKPDWANAYYNLAAAYREKGEFKSALENMHTVIRLVDPASTDYQKAQTEITALEHHTPATPSPSPAPNPNLRNIQLPESAAPNFTPAPQPSPTP